MFHISGETSGNAPGETEKEREIEKYENIF